MKTRPPSPLLLIILDGWGYRQQVTDDNAIANANTPHWDKLWDTFPHMLINGSGEAVGLPAGQMGNSEVGHISLGSGRVVYQDSTRISHAITSGEFFTNDSLNTAIHGAINKNKAIHILGLLSPGGVHSHEDHIHAICQMAAKQGADKLYLHGFLDGRDTPPRSAMASIEKITTVFQQIGIGKIASLIGRYYAMDRDDRWERIKTAYQLLTAGESHYQVDNAAQGLQLAYENGENDEFVKPISIHQPAESPTTIQAGDAVIFMNFRADRARELTRAFVDENFTHFHRTHVPQLSSFTTLTTYSSDMPVQVAFKPEHHQQTLGQVIADHGLKQLRIAETEKYAHVTFFFNGGIEAVFPQEERILVPSPKVATYDLQPQMSAQEITDKLIDAINHQQHDVMICNFANADMVGHTGNFTATIKAVETLDHCLGRLVEAVEAKNGEMLITADHGNAEKMYNPVTQQAHTAHTCEPVPLIYVGKRGTFYKTKGILSDIAPTMLNLLNLPIPREMTGSPLLRLGSSNN